MALTTQKLLIILIGLNLVIGMVTELYYNPQQYTESQQLGIEINQLQEHEIRTENNIGQGGTQSDNIQTDVTFGNNYQWGGNLFTLLARGLNPLSLNQADFPNQPEKTIINIITFLRSLITILSGLELYLVIKNKKTS